MNMNTKQQILKSPILKKGEDFSFLRQEGIRLLQQYSGTTWTDHNIHDPGITLLEAFCFALTELSLKADLDIKDILASSQQNSSNVLFGAEEILPVHPTTIKDYRKVLIDTEGVRNAWFIPLSIGETNNINGLYDVLLELDEDDTLGDINSSIIEKNITINIGSGDQDFTIGVFFPFWDEEGANAFQEIFTTIDNITSPGSASIILTPPSGEENDYSAELEITYNTISTTSFTVIISVNPTIGTDPIETTAVENEIITLLSNTGNDSFIDLFNRKVVAASTIENSIWEKLRAHRNLGEDIQDIKAVRIQEIGIDVSIEVLKTLNLEKYLASVLFELENFFRPPILFTSLHDLETKKISYENIFEGPLLANGFLDDAVLNDLSRGVADSRNSTVYISDLVNLFIKTALKNSTAITNIIENQVIAISNITISNYRNNKIVEEKVTDCLVLAESELVKPRFSFNKSNIQFYSGRVELDYNYDLVISLLDELRTTLQTSNTISNLPSIPSGESLATLSDYYSIQHEFPAAFGLGKNVLSNAYSEEHRAKVEQFRAYLTIIDQLLASYSNQLYHINDLFSIDTNVTNTYFKNPLYDIPYYERLLVDFLNSGQSWEDFKNDLSNDYQQALDEIFESNTIFLDRRNRFLDHLMARFGASLEHYISFRYEENSLMVDNSSQLDLRQLEIAHDLILDKINYLSVFPEQSKNRFMALNYSEEAWDTGNTSGLSKRLLSALGLRNLNRRTLHNEVDNFIQIVPDGPDFIFEIIDSNSDVILRSVGNYPNALDAQNEARETIRQAIDRDHYFVEPQGVSPVTYVIGFQPESGNLPTYVATSPLPSTNDEFAARTNIRHIIRELKEIGSGVYIVEHILLRPNEGDTIDLEIPINETNNVSNPYSMRISSILPSGFERDFAIEMEPIPSIPAQFQNEKFRNLIVKQINEETPAHILAGIYWLDINTGVENANTPSLNNFTARWRAWLEAKEDASTPINVLSDRRSELITVLNEIYQISA